MTAPEVVLVHSPFVGPASVSPVAAALRALGYAVAEPARSAAWDVGPPYYRELARRVASAIKPDPETPLVLVAHSGAGGLLPSVAEAVQGRVCAAIFLDALTPHPGQTWFETAPAELRARLRSRTIDGRLPAWSGWFPSEVIANLLPDLAQREAFIAELEAVPAAYVDEVAPECPHWPPAGCGYLQLSEGYAAEADQASAAGWIVERDIIHHLATATHPDRVASSLHLLISALTASS